MAQNGDSPLHHAAKYGCTEIVSVLISNGAHTNSKNYLSKFITKIASLFISNGADTNIKNKVSIFITILAYI